VEVADHGHPQPVQRFRPPLERHVDAAQLQAGGLDQRPGAGRDQTGAE
jgi:hypothetical protein